jgi:GAF domain-containing protein
MAVDVTLLERLPDPVLLVLPSGETRYGNRAWQELAAQHGVAPQLAALFGAPVASLLAEARNGGTASVFLPLAAGGDATRGYRVTVRGGGDDGSLVVQLADLSEEVAWRHQLFLRNSELSVLNDVGAALSGTLMSSSLAERIWEQTGRIMDNSNFFIALRDRERTGTLRFPIWIEDGKAMPGPDATFGDGVARHVLASHQPLLLTGDVAEQLAQMGLAQPPGPCAALLATPILSEGEPLGMLAVLDPSGRAQLSRHQLGILNIVATQAASAIRTAWMFEAMRLAYDELSSTQARLLESERLRTVTETVGTLNHEVNNPLATIVGTAQLMLRHGGLDDTARDRVERMLEAAKRIQFVTSKMATLIQATSRPYPGQGQILDVARSISRHELPVVPAGPIENAMRAIRESLPGVAPEREGGNTNAA